MADLPEYGADDALYIFDLHCWLYRFWHTIQGRCAHGFIEMVQKIIADRDPRHLVVCRDMSGLTFRHEMHQSVEGGSLGYKGHREAPDPTLLERIRWAHELLEDVVGVPVYGRRGFEADDLIAALATQAKTAGLRVVIVAHDKDLMQLVDDRCVLWDGKHRVTGPEEVEAKFGVRVDQLRDYLAICGDASDNVPGIHGAGPVAAKTILQEFGTLDEALQCAQFPYDRPFFKNHPSYRTMLKSHRKEAQLSQRLVTLALDAPVTLNTEEIRRA